MATVTANGSRETSSQANNSRAGAQPVKVKQQFCPDSVQDPFDTVAWELRSAQIKGAGRLQVDSRDGKNHVDLQAKEGSPWTVTTRVEDATLGVDTASTQFLVDVAADSRAGDLRVLDPCHAH